MRRTVDTDSGRDPSEGSVAAAPAPDGAGPSIADGVSAGAAERPPGFGTAAGGATQSTGPLDLPRAIALRLIAPAAIGAATGACVAAASYLTESHALARLAALPVPIPAFFTPLALILTLLVVTYVTRATRPSTAELYIVTYHQPAGRLPLRQIPGRVLGAMTTVAFGGSQGLESASALIGAAFGDLLGNARAWAKLVPEEERRSLMVAGASAGIAAVFSSPAVGALYGMEIPFRRDVDARRLVPCAIAAGFSFLVRDRLVGGNWLVVLDSKPPIDGTFALGVLLVGVACGLGARLFAWSGDWLRATARRLSPWPRALVGGVVLVALAWSGHALAGEWITFGPGYIAAHWLDAAPHPLWLLAATVLVRTAGTLTCVAAGGGGGVFTSLACTGVFVGQMVADLLGRPEGHIFPFLGGACFLASGYRLPLACLMYVFEGSPSFGVAIGGLVAICIGQVLMGRDSVSDAKHRDRLD